MRAVTTGKLCNTVPALRTRLAHLLALCAVAACGGATWDGQVYRDREAAYRVGAIGPGWRVLDLEGHNDLSWGHEALAAVVQVNARCDPADDIPLPTLRNHLLFGFTDRQIHAEGRVTLDGREALVTHAAARLDGVERELLLTVLKKDGCVYDLALVAPPGRRFEEARAAYDRVVAGFTTRVRGSR